MKIHIVSGFLGAGKTTFIKKWIPSLKGKVCLIENEFGDTSIDSRLFPQTVEVREIYAGCICCSLSGSFKEGIKAVYEDHHPDHLIIEPSGVGALTEVLKICKKLIQVDPKEMTLGCVFTLVDVTAFKDYVENFGSFYTDQIESAPLIFLSFIKNMNESSIGETLKAIEEINQSGQIVFKDWLNMDIEEFNTIIELSNKELTQEENNKELESVTKILSSFSIKRPKAHSLESFLQVFNDFGKFSSRELIRSKGVIKLISGEHIHFDYTPFHKEWRYIDNSIDTGIVFIGQSIDERIFRKVFSKSAVIKQSNGGN